MISMPFGRTLPPHTSTDVNNRMIFKLKILRDFFKPRIEALTFLDLRLENWKQALLQV